MVCVFAYVRVLRYNYTNRAIIFKEESMSYIKKDDMANLDVYLRRVHPASSGELNFCITQLIQNFLGAKRRKCYDDNTLWYCFNSWSKLTRVCIASSFKLLKQKRKK